MTPERLTQIQDRVIAGVIVALIYTAIQHILEMFK